MQTIIVNGTSPNITEFPCHRLYKDKLHPIKLKNLFVVQLLLLATRKHILMNVILKK